MDPSTSTAAMQSYRTGTGTTEPARLLDLVLASAANLIFELLVCYVMNTCFVFDDYRSI